LERRLVDRDLDTGFDKSAPQSAKYHNLGPAEAGEYKIGFPQNSKGGFNESPPFWLKFTGKVKNKILS
jgi:hypothetical protein